MNCINFRFLAIVFSISLTCICFSSLADEYKYEVEQKVSYDNVYTVTLKNQAGNVELESSEEEEISVKMIKIIDVANEQVARDFAKKIELALEKSDDTLSIETALPEKRSEAIGSINLDYKIKVPRDIALKIQNKSGNAVIKGIYGDQEIIIDNGNVELIGTIGKFNVKVNNGNILGTILLNGESIFYTNNGNISIDILDPLFYATSAETNNGSIAISLPIGLSAVIKADTQNGAIYCNLPVSITQQSDSSIEGVLNNSGPLLQIRAVNGDIKINEGQTVSSTTAKKESSHSEDVELTAETDLPSEKQNAKKTSEQDNDDLDVIPILNFNRVQGLVIGGALQVSTVRAGGGRIYENLEYGSANEMWNYQFGAEKNWLDKHKIAIGMELYKLTDTNDNDLLSESEDFLSTFLFGNDIRDYFLREGYKSWLSVKLTPSTKLKVQYNKDEYSTLFKMTDWCLLNSKKPKSSNGRIDEGLLKSVTFSYMFDSRDVKEHERRNDFTSYPVPCRTTKNGWLGYLSMEYAGSKLGGDFDHVLYRFKLVRYNRISPSHAFDFRVQGGISTNLLPRQKIFYLGGIGTIRGYELKEFVGDNTLLVNLEYSLKLSRYFWTSIFWDSGYVGFYDQDVKLDDLHSSAGLGLKIVLEDYPIILYFAQPLEKDCSPGVILRLDRMF